jgi:hypothetical protein
MDALPRRTGAVSLAQYSAVGCYFGAATALVWS